MPNSRRPAVGKKVTMNELSEIINNMNEKKEMLASINDLLLQSIANLDGDEQYLQLNNNLRALIDCSETYLTQIESLINKAWQWHLKHKDKAK